MDVCHVSHCDYLSTPNNCCLLRDCSLFDYLRVALSALYLQRCLPLTKSLLKAAIHQEINDKLIGACGIECKVQSMAGAGEADGFKSSGFRKHCRSCWSHAEVQ